MTTHTPLSSPTLSPRNSFHTYDQNLGLGIYCPVEQPFALRLMGTFNSQIEDLQRENQRLREKNRNLREKLQNKKDTIVELRLQLESLKIEGNDSDVIDFAKALNSSMILFQEIPAIPAPPAPPAPPSVKEKITLITGSGKRNSFDLGEVIIQTNYKLRPYNRMYVWQHEPTEMEKMQYSWGNNKLAMVNEASALLIVAQKFLDDCKNNPDLNSMDMDPILETLKKLKNEDEYESDQIPLEENKMLCSMLNPAKLRNVKTPEELVQKLQDICFEKKLQLGRSLNYLNDLLQEKIANKRQSTVETMFQFAERKRLEALNQETEKGQKDAMENVRKLLWTTILSNVERMTFAINKKAQQKDFDINEHTVEEIAATCTPYQIQEFIKKLKNEDSLSKYDSVQNLIATLKERLGKVVQEQPNS